MILSLNEVLKNEIQQFLGGSDAVMIKTIMDLSSRVGKGMDRVTIPRVSGLALSNVVPGTRAVAGGMTTAGDALLLDQKKEVPEYIDYDDNLDSAVDLKSAFLEAAPRVYAEGIELAITAALEAGVNAANFESPTAGAGLFSIADFSTAKKALDELGVPKSDRWVAVNAASMEVLSGFTEFEDGSKGLSDEALKQGVVSQVKGFKVVQSEDVSTNKILAYHRSACAFAMHDSINFIEKVNEEYSQEFISLRGKYGVKLLDSSNRVIVISTAI